MVDLYAKNEDYATKIMAGRGKGEEWIGGRGKASWVV